MPGETGCCRGASGASSSPTLASECSGMRGHQVRRRGSIAARRRFVARSAGDGVGQPGRSSRHEVACEPELRPSLEARLRNCALGREGEGTMGLGIGH